MRPVDRNPRGMLALALLGAVLSAARYLPTIDDPWDRSTGSINACCYFGRVEQNWRRYGFASLHAAPNLYRAPVRPGSIPPELVSYTYVNHPALVYWLVH